MNVDELYDLINTGRYDLVILREYLELMDKNIPHGFHRVKQLASAFNSDKAAERLLNIVFENPNGVYEILSRRKQLIQGLGGVLLKAYIISSLFTGNEALVSSNIVFREILELHPLISMYNPLVLFYVNIRRPDLFKKAIVKPIYTKLALYEANPHIIKTILFRDFLLTIGLCRETVFETLYNGMNVERYALVKSYCSQVFDQETSSIAINAYMRVLRSLIEILRYVMISIDRYDKLINRLSRERRDNILYFILDKYFNSSRDKLALEASSLIKIFDGLVAYGRDNVADAIVKAINSFIEDKKLGIMPLYNALTLYIEIAFLLEDIKYYPHIADRIGLTNQASILRRLLSLIEKSLVKRENDVNDILNNSSEPYITLRRRVLDVVRRGYLEWLKKYSLS